MDIKDEFINISASYRNLDSFYHRRSIVRALDAVLLELHGELLDAGCGEMPYREYILENSAVEKYTGLELTDTFDKSGEPDCFWDGETMPFDGENFDCVISTEVLEHVFEPQILFGEIRRVLKPGGLLFLTTPFIWNLHEQPFDYYRYTPFAIRKLLEEAGFENIEICALGGWHASLAQMLGLWVRRSGLNTFMRRIFSFILKPVISWLCRHDRRDIDFNRAAMITGISVVARKSDA